MNKLGDYTTNCTFLAASKQRPWPKGGVFWYSQTSLLSTTMRALSWAGTYWLAVRSTMSFCHYVANIALEPTWLKACTPSRAYTAPIIGVYRSNRCFTTQLSVVIVNRIAIVAVGSDKLNKSYRASLTSFRLTMILFLVGWLLVTNQATHVPMHRSTDASGAPFVVVTEREWAWGGGISTGSPPPPSLIL